MPQKHHLFFLVWSPCPHAVDGGRDGIGDASHWSVVVVFFIDRLIFTLLLNILTKVTSLDQYLDLVLELVAFFSIVAIVTMEVVVLSLTSPIRMDLH